MPTILSREELFEKVWERPMTKVAAEYGISDVALKKICDKHRIPVPGRGYWAKKAAGKKVQQASFRPVGDPAINKIIIHGGSRRDLPTVVKRAVDTAKQRERHPDNKVKVAAALENLHPKVERTKKKLEQAKPSERGLVASSGADLFNVEVGPKSIARAVAFLDALVKAAEARGYPAVDGERALRFNVEEEPVDLKIVEQVTRSKHTPTEAELAAVKKWEDRQRRLVRNWTSFDWTPRPTPPEWDYAPNGRLQVIINEGRYGHQGLRRTFGDGRSQQIETVLNGILEALVTWSASIKAQRIEAEQRKRAWEEEQRRREERRQREAL